MHCNTQAHQHAWNILHSLFGSIHSLVPPHHHQHEHYTHIHKRQRAIWELSMCWIVSSRENFTCIPISNKTFKSYSIGYFLTLSHTFDHSQTHTRTHRTQKYIHVCAGFLLATAFYCLSFLLLLVLLSFQFSYVCVYLCTLELFCARCCWVTFTIQKCAIKQNKTKTFPITHFIFRNVSERHSRSHRHRQYVLSITFI